MFITKRAHEHRCEYLEREISRLSERIWEQNHRMNNLLEHLGLSEQRVYEHVQLKPKERD